MYLRVPEISRILSEIAITQVIRDVTANFHNSPLPWNLSRFENCLRDLCEVIRDGFLNDTFSLEMQHKNVDLILSSKALNLNSQPLIVPIKRALEIYADSVLFNLTLSTIVDIEEAPAFAAKRANCRSLKLRLQETLEQMDSINDSLLIL